VGNALRQVHADATGIVSENSCVLSLAIFQALQRKTALGQIKTNTGDLAVGPSCDDLRNGGWLLCWHSIKTEPSMQHQTQRAAAVYHITII
jgi:hypothetical protein